MSLLYDDTLCKSVPWCFFQSWLVKYLVPRLLFLLFRPSNTVEYIPICLQPSSSFFSPVFIMLLLPRLNAGKYSNPAAAFPSPSLSGQERPAGDYMACSTLSGQSIMLCSPLHDWAGRFLLPGKLTGCLQHRVEEGVCVCVSGGGVGGDDGLLSNCLKFFLLGFK